MPVDACGIVFRAGSKEVAMTESDNNRQRFSVLLPFYVNSTLNAQDHEWISAYMAAHPESNKELTFVNFLRDTTRNTESMMPESQRLDRLLSQWKQSKPAPTFLQKSMRWLQERVRIPVPAIALASIMIVGQAVVIGSLWTGQPDEATYRSERPECVVTPRIRVVFNPEVKHVEILLLLRKVEATVQNGPSETGALWLSVPKGRSLEEAQAMLRSSALVEEVVVMKESRLPAECAK